MSQPLKAYSRPKPAEDARSGADFLIRFLDLAAAEGFDLRSPELSEETLSLAFDHDPRYFDPPRPAGLAEEPEEAAGFTGYSCRWAVSLIANEDSAEELERVLDAGFPLEAPVAFWSGTLAHLFAQFGAERCLRLALARGANVWAINDGGETPIFQAAGERHTACVLTLIEAGSPWRREELPEARSRAQALGSIALRSLANDYSGSGWDASNPACFYQGVIDLLLALQTLGEPLERLFVGDPEKEALQMDLPPGLMLGLRSRLDEEALDQALSEAPLSRGPLSL